MDKLSPAQTLIQATKSLSKESGIEVCLVSAGHSTVILLAIWSHAQRRAGLASATLKRICSLADTYAVDIKLTPRWMAYEEHEDDPSEEISRLDDLNAQKLGNKQLIAWYERNGFQCTQELDGDFPVMVRAAYHSEISSRAH